MTVREKSKPRIQFPHPIATGDYDYDYENEIIHNDARREYRMGFPVPEHRVGWALNVFPAREKSRYIFIGLDGAPAAFAKEAIAWIPQLEFGSRHTHLVKVRNGEVAAFFDGKQIVRWKGDLRRFKRPSFAVRDPRFPDFFVHEGGIVIHQAKIIEFVPQ